MALIHDYYRGSEPVLFCYCPALCSPRASAPCQFLSTAHSWHEIHCLIIKCMTIWVTLFHSLIIKCMTHHTAPQNYMILLSCSVNKLIRLAAPIRPGTPIQEMSCHFHSICLPFPMRNWKMLWLLSCGLLELWYTCSETVCDANLSLINCSPPTKKGTN